MPRGQQARELEFHASPQANTVRPAGAVTTLNHQFDGRGQGASNGRRGQESPCARF